MHHRGLPEVPGTVHHHARRSLHGLPERLLLVIEVADVLAVDQLGKGHADIALEPLVARYPHLRRGYLIELKYLKRSERLQRSEALDEAGIAAAAAQANAQLLRYLVDERLARQFPGVRFIGLTVVFHGWELVHCEAVGSEPR